MLITCFVSAVFSVIRVIVSTVVSAKAISLIPDWKLFDQGWRCSCSGSRRSSSETWRLVGWWTWIHWRPQCCQTWWLVGQSFWSLVCNLLTSGGLNTLYFLIQGMKIWMESGKLLRSPTLPVRLPLAVVPGKDQWLTIPTTRVNGSPPRLTTPTTRFVWSCLSCQKPMLVLSKKVAEIKTSVF